MSAPCRRTRGHLRVRRGVLYRNGDGTSRLGKCRRARRSLHHQHPLDRRSAVGSDGRRAALPIRRWTPSRSAKCPSAEGPGGALARPRSAARCGASPRQQRRDGPWLPLSGECSQWQQPPLLAQVRCSSPSCWPGTSRRFPQVTADSGQAPDTRCGDPRRSHMSDRRAGSFRPAGGLRIWQEHRCSEVRVRRRSSRSLSLRLRSPIRSSYDCSNHARDELLITDGGGAQLHTMSILGGQPRPVGDGPGRLCVGVSRWPAGCIR